MPQFLTTPLVPSVQLSNSADPATPSGAAVLYSKRIAGKSGLAYVDDTGAKELVQIGLHTKKVFFASPANGTISPNTTGGVLSTSTTISHVQTFASANPWLATRRTRYTSLATAASATGARTNYARWFLGNAAGFGGFRFVAQFGQNTNLNGSQAFVGLCAQTTILAGDPSAIINMIGVGYDAADPNTGNWFLMRNDGVGVATKVDLGTGAARTTTHGYELVMFAAPNSSTIFVRVVNLHTGAIVLDTSYNTDVPAVNTGLCLKAECRNGAIAAATDIETVNLYVESDY